MTKLTINNKTTQAYRNYKIGDFYRDTTIKEYNVYIVTAQYINLDDGSNRSYFSLVNISTGHSYASAKLKISEITGGDDSDFELINDVEVIIS